MQEAQDTPERTIESPSSQDPASTPITSPSDRSRVKEHADGLKIEVGVDDDVDRRLAAIEMEGEEVAAGWKPEPHQPLSPEVRFLHVSRTIHQLITDRNRSVGIFLAVASLSFAASSALLNAKPDIVPAIPLRTLQYWCLPATFGTLAIIGSFMCLILIRTRIGLIYEVSKMNALLGLPSERVKRVNPLSIFFLMYMMVCLGSGASGGLAVGMLQLQRSIRKSAESAQELTVNPDVITASSSQFAVTTGVLVAALYTTLFMLAYYVMILKATTPEKLVTTDTPANNKAPRLQSK